MDEKIIDDLIDKMHTNYISDARFETLYKRWNFISTFAGKVDNVPIRDVIKKLIDDGYRVKTGYSASSVRGYRNYWILKRKP